MLIKLSEIESTNNSYRIELNLPQQINRFQKPNSSTESIRSITNRIRTMELRINEAKEQTHRLLDMIKDKTKAISTSTQIEERKVMPFNQNHY